jgi:hypothetical protein
VECILANHSLVQEHAFWEIKDGKEALFWTNVVAKNYTVATFGPVGNPPRKNGLG